MSCNFNYTYPINVQVVNIELTFEYGNKDLDDQELGRKLYLPS